jgi:hypothetical protein
MESAELSEYDESTLLTGQLVMAVAIERRSSRYMSTPFCVPEIGLESFFGEIYANNQPVGA